MKRLYILGILAGWFLSVGVAGQASAQGCGPGPMIIKSKGSLQQSIAVSTNATFFPTHTIAITLGTSGCSNSGLIQRERERRMFVAVNLETLSQEMAQGGGESVNALAALMGCSAAAYPEFGRMTQAGYENLFVETTPEPARFVSALRMEMAAAPALDSCDTLG